MNAKQLAISIILKSGICQLLYRIEWYKSLFVDIEHELYPGNQWYRKHDERNYDVVNLGSSGGKWAFDYSAASAIKGMNWAQQPQTLIEDYNLLRNFHSILRKGGYVLITIMPFSSLNKETGMRDALRYLKLDTDEPIQPYKLTEARRYAGLPILFGKPALKALVKHLLGRERKPTPPAAPPYPIRTPCQRNSCRPMPKVLRKGGKSSSALLILRRLSPRRTKRGVLSA